MIFFWILFFHINIIESSHIRYLSLSNYVNHLTYYSPLKWLYVASTNSISIYDNNLILLQNITVQNSYFNDYDLCKINPCQCLNYLINNNDVKYHRSNLLQSFKLSNSINKNNHNLILYLEKDNKINNQAYLIDCWSLQLGSCIIRNAFNLSNIYYQQISTNKKHYIEKFLFNSDSTIPSHIFPFHFKYDKCHHTPTYLFLTSTLRKNFVTSNSEEKSDDLIDRFYFQCLERTQQRTIALRALIYNDGIEKSQYYVNKSAITTNTSANITIVKDPIMKRQVNNIEKLINKTKSSFNKNKFNLRLNTNLSDLSTMSSVLSDDHITNENKKNESSSFNFTHDKLPFLNINEYCPEQLSVIRSIYTDFFERESSDKFRFFQDIIYDEHNSAIYLFTNQQFISKIVRLCEGQISFRHYVEIEIDCGHDYKLIQKVKLIKFKNNKQYLLTIVSKPKTFHSLEPSINSHSAICLYDFDQIRNTFIDNILNLAKGNISLGMAWLHGESVIVRLNLLLIKRRICLCFYLSHNILYHMEI